MKKILSFLLALSLVFALFAGLAGTASADDYDGGKYYAWDNGDGTCTISYKYEYSYLTEITVPKYVNGMRVAALADGCFAEFYDLETVILPEHLSYIGPYAFAACESLKSIRIPASVTELNPEAFTDSCLNEINVSSSSKTFCSIDGVVFTKDKHTLICYPCDKEDQSYTIPNGVKRINDCAFEGSRNLTSVIFPDSVTECGICLFRGSWDLQNVTLSKSMTEIPPYMFYSTNISSITIPDSITAIGEEAFEDCWNLSSINLPDSLVSIGDYAFFNCGNYNGIRFVLPKNVSHVGIAALRSASSISVVSENPYFASENGVLFSKDMTKLIQYPTNTTARSYAIPSTVTEIGVSAFENAWNLQAVSMPDSVVSIGEAAFRNSALTSAVISQGVQEIPPSAFSDCYNLTHVLLPDNLTAIGAYAFSWDYALQNISLPDSVQTLGDGAFVWCENLTKMEIPFGVTQISESLFAECTSLTSVVIPSSVGEIEYGAFNECRALSSVEFTGTEKQWNTGNFSGYYDGYNDYLNEASIRFTGTDYEDNLFFYVEDGRCGKISLYALTNKGRSRSLLEIPEEVDGKPIEMIASHAFEESDVREAVLPEGIKTLGAYAFDYCYGLKKVSLPSTLTFIGAGAFQRCESLQSITIPDSVTALDSSVFRNCYNLESVVLPNQLTSIPDFAFTDCTSLSSVELPESIKSIGYEAFWYCNSLKNITLPDGVETLEDWAFDECYHLDWIYIPESVSNIGYNSFGGCENLKSIFYAGSYDQWNNIYGASYIHDYCDATVYFDCNPVVSTFMDVKASDWFKDAVAYAYENELMNGTSDMLFTPSGSLTRGQLVTILYRVAGQPEVETAADFSDVPAGKYFSNAVAWAAENGIVNGYNDGTFKPDSQITREQIATILYRYANSPEVTGTLDFPDASKAGNYAKDALIWATQQGLINGIKVNGVATLAPKNTATRAQIATIIMRYLEAE